MSFFHADWSKVVAIEKMRWKDNIQDWTAILVFDGGARVETDIPCETALRRMNETRKLYAEDAAQQEHEKQKRVRIHKRNAKAIGILRELCSEIDRGRLANSDFADRVKGAFAALHGD